MRITEGQLRRIIREELLSEAPPLLDMSDFENPLSQDKNSPSIGHSRTRSRHARHKEGDYELRARELMKDTADNWVIVGLSDTRNADQAVKTDAFMAWLKEKNYPKGTRILVVAGAPYTGDGSTPAWQIAHDIFGHTIEQEMWNQFKRPPFVDQGMIDFVAAALHNILPRELRLAELGSGDIIPDILGAIFLKRLDQEKAMRVIERLTAHDEESKRICTHIVTTMFNSVELWLAKGSNKEGVIVARPY